MSSNPEPAMRSEAGGLDREEGLEFRPQFSKAGLLPAIVTAVDGGVLMFAYMNEAALALTLETGEVHFWSRSRQALWRKGETSGNRLYLVEMRTDCDQDVIWVKARLDGTAACHTGRASCFYRRVEFRNGKPVLSFIEVIPPRS